MKYLLRSTFTATLLGALLCAGAVSAQSAAGKSANSGAASTLSEPSKPAGDLKKAVLKQNPSASSGKEALKAAKQPPMSNTPHKKSAWDNLWIDACGY